MKHISVSIGMLAVLMGGAGCGGGSSSHGCGSRCGSVAASVSSTITVGTTPSAIVADSTANKIYVVDFGTIPRGIPCSASGADVEAIDGATQSVTSVGFYDDVNASAAALNPVSHQLYVEVEPYWNGIKRNAECGAYIPGLERFDTSPLQLEGGITVAGRGIGIDCNPATGTNYVTRGDVFVLDSGWQNVATIPVGSFPVGVAVNATLNQIYVANSGSNDVSVIDGASNSVVATITDPRAVNPVAIAVNPTTNTIYVANSKSNNLTIIDGATNTVTATIAVGTAPSGVAVDSQTNFIYVANAGNSQTGDVGNVTVIDGKTNATQTLIDPNAKKPVAVDVNPTTNKIYVANSGSNNVTVIDGAHD